MLDLDHLIVGAFGLAMVAIATYLSNKAYQLEQPYALIEMEFNKNSVIL